MPAGRPQGRPSFFLRPFSLPVHLVIWEANLPGAPVADETFWIARAKKGDLEAMESLFRSYERPVYSLARRICKTAEEAEDVLQETFLEVFKSLKSFRGDGPFGSWVKRIAATKALMRLRARRAIGVEVALDDGLAPEAALSCGNIPQAEAMDLEEALARLSEADRAVVWLHDVEGYTHEEIAGLSGLTPSFSKSRLARAHLKLREALGGKLEEKRCTRN